MPPLELVSVLVCQRSCTCHILWFADNLVCAQVAAKLSDSRCLISDTARCVMSIPIQLRLSRSDAASAVPATAERVHHDIAFV